MTPEQPVTCGLDEAYPLSVAQIEDFTRDGHILLRRVCGMDDLSVYRPAIERAVERFNTEKRAMADRDTYGKAFLQVMNLWTRDDVVKRFVLALRFARIAAELLQVDAVRLYHDQALFKEAGGGHTPWHQDQFYWPLDTDKTVTMWMPLVDVPNEMGAMTFAGGSHRAGFLGHLGISDESQESFDRLVHDRGFRLAGGPVCAGDATFHTGWTLHSAPRNATSSVREVMTIIYFADAVRTFTPDNANRQADLETWLPGVAPGELAAGKLNPVVYARS